MLTIDGAIGEGGGQILRTSLSLSCVLGAPFRMINIRSGREKPGLAHQHLAGLLAAKQITGAKVKGDRLGSAEISFEPGRVNAGRYVFEVGTAGSVSLVLHTLYLPLALAGGESRIKIEGGTHVDWSPPFDHLAMSWAKSLERLNLSVKPALQFAGFYPRGGGRIDVKIAPSEEIRPVEWLKRGPLKRLKIRAAVANLQEEIARRMISVSRRHAREAGLAKDVLDEEIHRPPCKTEGAYFFLLAQFHPAEGISEPPPPAGFAGIGRKGKRAEIVVQEAWTALKAFLTTDAPIEPHLADQLLLPLSLAAGPSKFLTSSITEHLLTNAKVVENFGAAGVEINGEKGGMGTVRVIPRK